MAKGDINVLAKQWSYYARGGARYAEKAMEECGWKDSTGMKIIGAVAETVDGYLDHALRLCYSLDGIDTSYAEEVLARAEEHLRERIYKV